jgi:hypothetical protein
MQPEGAQPNYNPKTLEKDIVYNTNQISLFPSKDEARSNALAVKKIKQEIIRIQSPPERLQSKLKGFCNPDKQKLIFRLLISILLNNNIFFFFFDVEEPLQSKALWTHPYRVNPGPVHRTLESFPIWNWLSH